MHKSFARSLALLLALAALAVTFSMGGRDVTAGVITTYAVDTTSDAVLSACVLATPADCSLRGAITAANGNMLTLDTIEFGIPDTDSGCQMAVGYWNCTITPGSPLPAITDPVIINGFTQTGGSANTNGPDQGINAVYPIEIDGTNTGTDGLDAALRISAGNTTVRGLVINRAGGSGIRMIGAGNNTIAGNIIGLDRTGTVDLGNVFDGVVAASPANTIGGTAPADRNVISGNGVAGIQVFAAVDNVIQGNFIGTNGFGAAALPNLRGISNRGAGAANTLMGGTIPAARNVISGNSDEGIAVSSGGGLVIQGNYVGVGVDGTTPLGNGGPATSGAGISHESFGGDALIGGPGAGEGNVIANNAGTGVGVLTSPSTVTILGNLIFNNGSMGIDVSPLPATPNPNDLDDVDTGPNGLQNYPLITGVFPGASTIIEGSLNSTPSTQFRVEFFQSDNCDATQYGEGQAFLGFADLTTDAGGDVTFSVTVTPTVPPGATVTATATNPGGGTSEFSHCFLDPVKGNVDCAGGINSIDALKLLRFSASLPVSQTEPCPNIGVEINANPEEMGDINCDGTENSIDALHILRHSASLAVNLAAGCRAIGTVHGTIIAAGDNFWQPTALSASKNRLVGLVVRNDGVFEHALRIAGADLTFDTPDDAVSTPAALSGGEKGAVAWQTPDIVAAVPFRCDFHPEMTGTINLK